ncbi:MAG: hypothetical protein ACK4OM_07135 [Alphaproteobacteria bacterium]
MLKFLKNIIKNNFIINGNSKKLNSNLINNSIKPENFIKKIDLDKNPGLTPEAFLHMKIKKDFLKR